LVYLPSYSSFIADTEYIQESRLERTGNAKIDAPENSSITPYYWSGDIACMKVYDRNSGG